MSRPIDDLSDAYVEAYARLNPVAATFDGIAGHDHELTDSSPDGAAERADHDRATLRALDSVALDGHTDRGAGGAIRGRADGPAAPDPRGGPRAP